MPLHDLQWMGIEIEIKEDVGGESLEHQNCLAWFTGLGGLRFYIAVDSVRERKYFEEKTALKGKRTV